MSSDMTQYESGRLERTHNRQAFAPRVDIYETPESIVVLADMPGVDEKDVDITLEKNVLTLEGNVASDERRGSQPWGLEYQTGDWRRVFTLSSAVDRDRIAAQLKDGVLRLVLPKTEPARARKIAVKAG